MIEMNLSQQARRIRRIALGDLLYRTAAKFGQRTALVDGEQRISYAELDARSSRFARYLLDSIGPGKQVGMLCANSIDMVVAFNGIHKASQVWVPVNIKLDVAAIGYILQHAEVSAVVVDQEMLGLPGLVDLQVNGGGGIMVDGTTDLAALRHICATHRALGTAGILPTLIVFLIGQSLESNFITPKLVGERIGLHPVAVIFALMAFGQLFGLIGVLLALPMAAVLYVGLRHLIVEYRRSRFYRDLPRRRPPADPPRDAA